MTTEHFTPASILNGDKMNKDYNLKNLKKYKRIAIMGGTFDPVHFGHLAAAEASREKFSLDRVLFIPSGTPPHKNAKNLTYAEHRYNMTRLAIKGNKYFRASRLEIDRPDVTYSVDTLKEIRKHMPDGAELYFIIGADTAPLVSTWKDYKKVIKLCKFIIVARQGYDIAGIDGILDNAEILSIPLLDISSTNLRGRIMIRNSIKYLLPKAVEKYIYSKGLYHPSEPTAAELCEYIKGILSKNRYLHTLGVLEEALKLSRLYGADEKKAEIAAILHDCAKDLSPSAKIEACKKYGIRCSGILKKQIDLTHPLIGARIAEEKFGITDFEILDAIKYHTTGRRNMSLLEKIIYVADCIEKNRVEHENLVKMRSAAYESIDKALIIGLKSTIAYTEKRNLPLHPLSKAALEYLTDDNLL